MLICLTHIPVLALERPLQGLPCETRAAIGEHPVRNLGPHVERDDIEDVMLRAVGDA